MDKGEGVTLFHKMWIKRIFFTPPLPCHEMHHMNVTVIEQVKPGDAL